MALPAASLAGGLLLALPFSVLGRSLGMTPACTAQLSWRVNLDREIGRVIGEAAAARAAYRAW